MSHEKLQKLYNLYYIPGFLNSVQDQFLKELLTIMVRAGAFALSIRQLLDIGVEVKGAEDYVTTVDINNQDYLVGELLVANLDQILKSPLPLKMGFVLEEDTAFTRTHAAKGDEDIFIYIDPIDGTTSYKDDKDDFCIGVSIDDKEGQPYYSAVYVPSREEIIVVDREHTQPYVFSSDGSVKEIPPNTSTAPASLQKVAAHYNPAHREKLLEVYSILAGKPVKWHNEVASEEERFGDNPVPGSLILDLCDLARGKYDIVINGGCHLWDFAPAIHVFEKTGYEIVDWSGKKIDLASFKGQDQLLTIVAGKSETIELFFKKLKEAGISLV